MILKNVEKGSKTTASVNKVVTGNSSCKWIDIATRIKPHTNTQPTLPDLDLSISKSYITDIIMTPVKMSSG